ncbi:MAG: hypothetical protein OHK0039_43760 [Bacteroidia bacterium]
MWATLVVVCAWLPIYAQPAYFFRDSDDPRYYDSGLAFPTAPSTLAQAGPSGDKIPVEADAAAFQGENSLRLTWTSRPGGNWSALVIAPGFPFQNITGSDMLSFWVYSEQGMPRGSLPRISMEGAPGATKSRAYSLKNYTDDIPAQTWTEIQVPLSVFFNDPDQTNIQFSQVKAIIFGQDSADQTTHTLLIDDVKTYATASASDPLAAPTGFEAAGYDSHVELRWLANAEPYLDGYRLYVSRDSGQTFVLRRMLDKNIQVYEDFVRDWGTSQHLRYYLRAVNLAGGESPSSDTMTATVRVFSDEELLDMVQAYTFRYFWDFAHPVSGMARERSTSGNTVTTGGSGFGLMAILVGIERSFVTRAAARARLAQILTFLQNADRFHGAWPHWMDGQTGTVIPFSTYDNGGDLIETAFMAQGLLAVRQYFDGSSDTTEQQLSDQADFLWRGIEWNWYRKLTQQVLFWHWSPNYAWQMNFQIRGYNEGLIAYLLALASPTHPVPASLYANGWAGSGYANGNSYYGYPLAVGSPRGGPLFFAHYSYLGFDPRYVGDAYTNYFTHNYYHTLVNRQWCIENTGGYEGYGPDCWGLTASDDPLVGYLAHEPVANRDNGTIAPTAALSSMPYTPELSVRVLKHFYRNLGRRLWGPMGFYDAFNLEEDWYARSYLAIDQGPIVVMIENHRSALLWEQFMSSPEIGPALAAAGFVADTTNVRIDATAQALRLQVYPQPARDEVWVRWEQDQPSEAHLACYDEQGRRLFVQTLPPAAGERVARLDLRAYAAGVYLLHVEAGGRRTWRRIVRLP